MTEPVEKNIILLQHGFKKLFIIFLMSYCQNVTVQLFIKKVLKERVYLVLYFCFKTL